MRDRLAVVFAVLLVGAVAAGVWWLLFGRATGPSREEEARTLVAEYAAAWEDGDWEAMADLVLDAPSGFVPLHRSTWEDLEVTGTAVEAGEVIVERGQADVDLTVSLDLADLGPWRYPTHLTLFRNEGAWRVSWSPAVLHPDLAEGLSLSRRITDEPPRAPILAHDGTPLTGEQTVFNVGIHPARVQRPDEVVAALVEYAGADGAEVEELLAQPDLNPEWFYPVTTLREELFREVDVFLRAVPGIVFREETGRLAPTDEFARHILGRTGEITAELLEELGPDYEAGDQVGLFGLERVFEEQLTGSPSGQVVLVDGEGVVEVLEEFGGDRPEPVRTTLDVGVQEAVEVALDGVDQPAALVAVDASTGAIRGSASRPLGAFDRALSGSYPPGSTFKIVTAAAVIDRLGLDPSTTCPAEVVVGGLTIRNAEDLALPQVSLDEAFARSCNTAFAQYAADLDEGDVGQAATAFGFGADYELPLAVAGGSFPEPQDLAERAAAAIGQARVQASPLHLATVAAAVADGAWRPPFLLAGGAASGASRPLDPRAAGRLQELMRQVVTVGTGIAAEVPGEPAVHGKTGSAEFGTEPGPEGQLPTHAWFAGFRGDLAFAVLVEGGGSGSAVAAPIAARFVEALDAT